MTMGLLTGKVALITGATRGIGRAIALKFASEGADVAFTYRSQAEAAASLTSELEGMGVRAKGYQSDAADFTAAHTIVDDVKSVFGHIVTVYFHTSSVGGCASQLQVSGVYLFRSGRLGQLVCLLGAQAQCAGQSQQEGNTLFHIVF